MRRKPTYSFTTSYHVYYSFGSVYSGSLSAPSRKELLLRMRLFAKQQDVKNVEVVTFEAITKTVATREVKGRFIKFKPRPTNSYIGNGPTKKYYKPMELC